MTATLDIAARKLDLGRVARDTMAVTGKRPGFVLGLAALLAGVPSFFGSFYTGRHMHAPLDYFFSGFGLLNMVVLILAGAFLAACLFTLSLRELEGETPTPSEVFSAGGQMFLPLLGLNILFAIALCVGMIFLIVPGVLIGVTWFVAGPALIAERTGITQSFRRSADLTRGNRWQIFALAVLFFIAQALVQSVLGAVGFAVSWGSADLFSAPRLLGSALLATISTALIYPGVVAVYMQLREIKAA